MGFQIFPDPFYPFGGIRVVVQQAFKEARISAAVNGFDVPEPHGQAPSQPQTAGVGVGFIFLLPASETGNEEHRCLEEEGKDIVLEADEKGHQVDEETQEGNPYEETADEENSVVHQNDDLSEPGHAYAEQAGAGVASLDMAHFMGHDAKELLFRKLAEQRRHDHNALSQGKGIVFIPKTYIQAVVRRNQISPPADVFKPFFQKAGVFAIGLPPAFGIDKEPLHHPQPRQNGRNEHRSQSQLHQKRAVIGTCRGAANVIKRQHHRPEGEIHNKINDKGQDN